MHELVKRGRPSYDTIVEVCGSTTPGRMLPTLETCGSAELAAGVAPTEEGATVPAVLASAIAASTAEVKSPLQETKLGRLTLTVLQVAWVKSMAPAEFHGQSQIRELRWRIMPCLSVARA